MKDLLTYKGGFAEMGTKQIVLQIAANFGAGLRTVFFPSGTRLYRSQSLGSVEFSSYVYQVFSLASIRNMENFPFSVLRSPFHVLRALKFLVSTTVLSVQRKNSGKGAPRCSHAI